MRLFAAIAISFVAPVHCDRDETALLQSKTHGYLSKGEEDCKSGKCTPGTKRPEVTIPPSVPSSASCICETGTPGTGCLATTNRNKCSACQSGYKLVGTICEPSQCYCDHGTATSYGCYVADANKHSCSGCESAWVLKSGKCLARPIACTCPNGEVSNTARCFVHQSLSQKEQCGECNAGYVRRASNKCRKKSVHCVCRHGTKGTGCFELDESWQKCVGCNKGFRMEGGQCLEITCDKGFRMEGGQCLEITCEEPIYILSEDGTRCVPAPCPTDLFNIGACPEALTIPPKDFCAGFECKPGFNLKKKGMKECSGSKCRHGECCKKRKPKPSVTPKPCMCPQIYSPVCAGTNTYSNECEAKCAGQSDFLVGACPEALTIPPRMDPLL